MPKSLIKLAIAGLVIILLPACSNIAQPNNNLVAQAYETSGIVAIGPYNRTIFNSSNF